jgi:hypothetical protein
MQPIDYTAFALMRAELHHDYSPANAQERLLVDEVARCWQRLEQSRRREDLFFDLQKTSMAIRSGLEPDAFKEDGGEVRMWIDQPHKAYDQVLRAIRDAGVAFDRAIRRIEQVRDRRLSRERADLKAASAKAARTKVVETTRESSIAHRSGTVNPASRSTSESAPRTTGSVLCFTDFVSNEGSLKNMTIPSDRGTEDSAA